MVIDRGAFLTGRYRQVFDEITAVQGRACGTAHLKVILETGELVTLDNGAAGVLAGVVGRRRFHQDVSTGKVAPGGHRPPVALVMLQAVRDYAAHAPARCRGVKLAGGIRTTKEAIRFLVMVNEVADDQLADARAAFRFGASSLLNDLLQQRHKLTTGVPMTGPTT